MNLPRSILCWLLLAASCISPWVNAQVLPDMSAKTLDADRMPTDPDRPNVLWIYVEDMNDWMGCYGDDTVPTPNIDALAARGTTFLRAYMPSAVCSPTRSAVITSMYQTSIGAHEHYSSIPGYRQEQIETWDPNYLGVRTIPEIMKLAGYYTFNEGKFHYNFVFDADAMYDRHEKTMGFDGARDGSAWSGRAADQPFFGQIHLWGGKPQRRNIARLTNRSAVDVPPYYPDHEIYREKIAEHYDTIAHTDAEVGAIIDALKRDGLYDSTIVFFFTDHGMGLPRHKQFLYEGGIRVPLIIAGPGLPQNNTRDDLVSGIDLGATALRLAGINIPPHMQGRNIFASDYHREEVFTARDRCDYTIDRIRAVVTDRYKYIRNYMTDRPYLQPQYRDKLDFMMLLRGMHADGTLTPEQQLFAGSARPAEELYDLHADPHETKNLVGSPSPEHQHALADMRTRLAAWELDSNDLGRFPESDAALRAVLQIWGDRAVNPEYDRVRD